MKLELSRLNKHFDGKHAIENASCIIEHFKTLAIIGPSGSGKSTLLRVLGGLEHPDSGKLLIDDKEISFDENSLFDYRKSIGFVFQAFNLFPHLNVLQNIELPLYRVHGLSIEEAKERALQFLSRFNLQEHAHKKPAQLSGGQRQRVAIVRAICINAKFILLDEPTSALDPFMTSEVLDMVAQLQTIGTSTVLVSHHIGFVRKVSDWVLFLDEGKILEYGPTKNFFDSPQTKEAQSFLDNVLKY